MNSPRPHIARSARLLVAAFALVASCGTSDSPESAGAGGGVSEASASIPFPESLDGLDVQLRTELTEARDALLADAESASKWMHLGMLFEGNEFFTLALDCYDRANAIEESAKTWSRIAQARAALGRTDRAAAAMRRSVRLVGDYAPSHWRLGNYLFDLGEFEEAGKSYTRATKNDPDHSGGWIGLARVLVQTDEPDKAVAVLEALLAKKPDDTAAKRLLRTAYLQAGRPEDVDSVSASWRRYTSPGKDPWLREFREYVERPEMEQALSDLQSPNPERAVETLERLSLEQPDDINVLSYLAWGYYRIDQTDAAIATIETALAKDPDSIPVMRIQARIYESMGANEDALGVQRRILELDANDLTALSKGAALAERLDDFAGAADAYSRLLELDRSDPDNFTRLGRNLFAAGRVDEAIEAYREATRSRSTGVEPYLGWARALASKGDWEEAEAVLGRAPDLDAEGAQLLEAVRARSL